MKHSGLAQLLRRRNYVIDRPMQYGAAAQLLVGLGMIGLLFAVGMFVFLGGDAMAGMNIAVIREFLLMANAVYFVLAAVILSVLTLLLTHRFAGPAFVLDQAIQAMLKGDYGKRLKLRKRDYMQGLSTGLEALRSQWMEQDEETGKAFAELERCLKEERLEDAKKILAALKDKRLVKTEAAPTADDEAAPAKPAKEAVTV